MYRLIIGKIKDEERNLFSKILENAKFDNSFWCISEDEIYIENKYDEELFTKNIYSEDDFHKITSSRSYYIINVIAKVFKEHDDIIDIVSIDDFIYSKCDMLIIITDSENIEIYIKDSIKAKTIFTNMEKYGLNPKYILEKNYRTSFEIW